MAKRLITFVLAAIMLGVMIPTTAMAATSGDYEYEDNGDGTCTISDYTGSSKNITIPSKLGGLTVTVIGRYAFFDNGLRSVTIPDSVRIIDKGAFQFNDLTGDSVDLGNGVTAIGELAFNGTDDATNKISLPSSLTYIGHSALFSGVNRTFKLPAGSGTWTGNGKVYDPGDWVWSYQTNYTKNDTIPTVSIKSDPSYINNGEAHEFRYTINFPCVASVCITDKNKNTIRVLRNGSRHNLGTHTEYWDGKDSDGKSVQAGEYYIYVSATNHVGGAGYKYKSLTYNCYHEYNSDGKLIKKIYLYSNGNIQRCKHYSSSTGNCYAISEYNSAGKLLKKKYLYSNGKLKLCEFYSSTTGNKYAVSEYNTSGKITKKKYLYSSGVRRKIEYYSATTGNKYAVSEYNTSSKITKKTYLYSSGVRKKTEYYSSSTGSKYAVSEYNTSGRITKKTYLYASGVRRKIEYYGSTTGNKYAVSEYRTNGSLAKKTYLYSNGVRKYIHYYSSKTGNKYATSYYDTSGDITKKVYYNSDGSVKETIYY